MAQLKALENLRIKERQSGCLEQELLTELYEIEKEIAKSRKEQHEADTPVLRRCNPISEEENNLDDLILKHCAVMRKLRILWTHNILKKAMFYMLYGGVGLKITD